MTLTLTVPDITIKPGARLHENLDTPELVEIALKRGEGRLSEHGALVVETGMHTGRSAQDKFIVRDVLTKDEVWSSSIWQHSTRFSSRICSAVRRRNTASGFAS
jgi:phosphoenolpyruvate carboxykinase (ATP)